MKTKKRQKFEVDEILDFYILWLLLIFVFLETLQNLCASA